MKKIIYLALVAFIVGGFSTSCKKEEKQRNSIAEQSAAKTRATYFNLSYIQLDLLSTEIASFHTEYMKNFLEIVYPEINDLNSSSYNSIVSSIKILSQRILSNIFKNQTSSFL